MYVNDLEVEMKKHGFKRNDMNTLKAIEYADDIVTLAETESELKTELKVV